MLFLKRSFLYIIRKRTRTAILFASLFVISTLALTALAVKKAAGTAQLNVRQALGGTFAVNQNTEDASKWRQKEVEGFGYQGFYDGEPLTEELGEYITENVKGIRGFNASYSNTVLPRHNGRTLELIEGDGAGEDTGVNAMLAAYGDFSSSVTIYANTNTAFDTYFTNGYLKLTKGRHVISGDEGAVLLSEKLAEKNGLDVGDELVLQTPEYKAEMNGYDAEETKTKVKIAGLFKPTSKSQVSISNWSMENTLFTTMGVVKNTRPDRQEESWEHLYFSVDDPGEMERITEDIKALPEFDADDFVIQMDNSAVEAVTKPLSNMDSLMAALIILILLVGGVILYLLLAGRIKERIHESGILLSIGIEKSAIIGQYLTEVMLVGMVAFVLAAGASGVISRSVGSYVLESAIADVEETEDMDEGIVTDGDGTSVMTGETFEPKFDGQADLTEIRAAVDRGSLLLIGGAKILIISASVLFASLPVFRLKPKTILQRLS